MLVQQTSDSVLVSHVTAQEARLRPPVSCSDDTPAVALKLFADSSTQKTRCPGNKNLQTLDQVFLLDNQQAETKE